MSLTFPTDRRLWFCLLNGPVVYTIYFLLGYLFVEAACSADLFTFNVLGLDMITFLVIVFTVLAAAVTGYGLFLSLRIWRRTHGTNDATDDAGYVPFMAFTGAWMSGLFTLVILLTGVPALYVVLCDWI
ncbi:hypothetical protein GC175_33660 [bacterium]|nr:hypothetical protein [bacterium]